VKELQGVDIELLDALRKDEEVKRRSMEVGLLPSLSGSCAVYYNYCSQGAPHRCLQHSAVRRPASSYCAT
jgi:hypothetical protein